jgi:hypothetical protein
MNKFSKILTLLIVLTGIVFIWGCVKEKFKAPAFIIPHSPVQSNTTIRQLKKMYNFSGTPVQIQTNVIIEGVVVADDQSGNYYEEVVMQDTSSGIEVLLNQSDLYTQYRIGQRLFIKCQGLYLGNYGGAAQLGINSGGAIGKIPPIYFNDYLFPDSLPGIPPAPKVLTIPALDSSNIDMLVQFNSVHFPNTAVGQIFAPQTANSTSQILYDNSSNLVTVYTSKYANFSADTIPSGKGKAVGILTNYKGWEIYLRTINDLVPGSGWVFN